MIQTNGETNADDKAKSMGKLGSSVSDCETWKFQGLRFLKQKNYHQAIKCFKFA